MAYIAPSLFLRSKNIKVTAGMILDPAELGMEPHPVFGPLPVANVLDAKDDGSVFLHAEIACSECGETRVIEPGDWFQVRRCRAHQKRTQRKSKKVAKTPEEIEAAKIEREAKQAKSSAEREIAKAERLSAEAQAKAEKAAATLAELAAKRALIEQVAAEKGAEISEKAVS
jgi:Na+-translocating ferredoxin:NAD+ oxidoreductase RnfC subunit